MARERREFLFLAFQWLAAAAGSLLAAAWSAAARDPQNHPGSATSQSPLGPLPPMPETPLPLPDPHKILEANEKKIKKDCDDLLKLAQELKDQVDKTDSAIMLSLPMISKAEQIEKLARQIRDLARAA